VKKSSEEFQAKFSELKLKKINSEQKLETMENSLRIVEFDKINLSEKATKLQEELIILK